jgi:hypothetical protein
VNAEDAFREIASIAMPDIIRCCSSNISHGLKKRYRQKNTYRSAVGCI